MRKILTLLLTLIPLVLAFSCTLGTTVSAIWDGDFEIRAVDGFAEIIGVSPNISGDVIIPDYYGGYGISNIAPEAFAGCEGITSVTFGPNIRIISYGAFKDCTSLTTVNFAATNCSATGSAERPVFEGCTSLTGVNISAGVKKIPDYMFYGVSTLAEVNFPPDMPKIGKDAFFGCPLIDINQPQSSSIPSKPISAAPSSSRPAASSKPAVSSTPLSSSDESIISPISSKVDDMSSADEVSSEIADTDTTVSQEENDSDEGGNNSFIYIWIIAGAALLLLGAVAVILLRDKK